MGLLSDRPEDEEEQGEISIAGLDGLDGGASEEIVYDLDEWSERDLGVLRERLVTLGVPHSWQGLTLVIAASDEAWVERIMDQVEDDLAVTLDPAAEQIAYDLTDWDDTSREELFDALDDEAIAYGIDGEELFVHEIDEQRVDELIESVLQPEDGQVGAAPAEAEVMGELFVAADRLVHDPGDTEGTLLLVEAIRRAGSSPSPYGMDKVWWDGVLGHADQLTVLLDDPNVEDQAIIDEATLLRDGLRPYV